MTYFTIKNWRLHQHYKKRNDPWIKLHTDLLTDYGFSVLSNDSKLILIHIWLLASKLGVEEPKIPNDPEWILKQTNLTGKLNLKPLFDCGFINLISNDSNEIAKDITSYKINIKNINKIDINTDTYTPDACAEAFEICWDKYPRKAGNKKKALDCFKKSVWAKGDQGQETFLKKMGAYVASVDDPGFLQHGETFFRNWQDLEISNIRPIKNETWEEKHERELQEVRDRHANA